MAPSEAIMSISLATKAALDEFLEWIPQPPVRHAIRGFFQALLAGLEHDNLVETVKTIEGGSSLEINLRATVVGTVATRSRVPAEWKLLPKIHVWIDTDETVGTKLRLSGIQVIPIEGATRAWKILAALFELKQASTLDEQRAVAWQWWDGDNGRNEFEGTKLWRVVESLALLGYGQVVPTYAKASLLLGCCLGVHQDVTTLHYRYDVHNGSINSSNGGNSSDNNNDDYQDVDVLGTLDPVAQACDPDSAEFNCNEEMKDEIGVGLWEETVSTPMKRMTATRCARSSLNYAALFCARPGRDQGASPDSLQKLVTVANKTGGATKVDVVKGKASPWQFHDETYQMTGDNGRILWRWVDGDK